MAQLAVSVTSAAKGLAGSSLKIDISRLRAASSVSYAAPRRMAVVAQAKNSNVSSGVSFEAASFAALASAALSLSVAGASYAADFAPPATTTQAAPQEIFIGSQGSPTTTLTAPPVASGPRVDLPEGTQWRYSEFVNAVQKGKVERVRFSKDGTMLQVRV